MLVRTCSYSSIQACSLELKATCMYSGQYDLLGGNLTKVHVRNPTMSFKDCCMAPGGLSHKIVGTNMTLRPYLSPVYTQTIVIANNPLFM